MSRYQLTIAENLISMRKDGRINDGEIVAQGRHVNGVLVGGKTWSKTYRFSDGSLASYHPLNPDDVIGPGVKMTWSCLNR